jgi:hypothetical protein
MSDDKKQIDFEKIQDEANIVQEFWEFIKENKKFWLIPIIIILLLLGLLIMLGGTAAAPFIYTLF